MKSTETILLFFFFALGSKTDVYANEYPVKKVTDTIPAMIQGNFTDDYSIRYSINDTLWKQFPAIKYHIISWNAQEQYLLARNDEKNPGEAGLYTRIDYMSFNNMEPFRWGFCLTVYNAKTMEEARVKAIADRQNPKKGCGEYPFSRMKRTD